jgi:hypothetical protein
MDDVERQGRTIALVVRLRGWRLRLLCALAWLLAPPPT